MHHAWIAFARAGNPNTPKLPDWPKFDANQRTVMVLDADCHIEADPFPDRMIWENIFQQMSLRKK
jgi:para-nitrobenzyl esterase